MSKNNRELKQENIDNDIKYCPECGLVLPSFMFGDNNRCIKCNTKRNNKRIRE